MWLSNYLKSGTKESSMRLGFLIVVILMLIIGCALAFQIIYLAMRGIVPDGNAIAAELAALGGFYTAAAYFKKEQKKIENNNSGNSGNSQIP